MPSSKRSKAINFQYEMDLVKLVDQFHDEGKARAYLIALRWPDGVDCPRCRSASIAALGIDQKFDCNSCRYQFTVTSGTILHDTHLPLWKWFLATYLMCESKKGMSALQMKRTLKVAYKTAWYLCHRIRAAMNDADAALLSGTVEVDETFVGGRRRHVGRGYVGNKTIAAGVVQRGGDVRLEVIPNRESKTLRAFIEARVSERAAAIYTDEHPSYQGIGDANTVHETVNHKLEEWVRGAVHTNTAESVWSLLERSIIGAFHHVSGKHLDRYLDELEWRFNNRRNPFLFRDTLRKLVESESLPYQTLTAPK
jgi:transposase-like protein